MFGRLPEGVSAGDWYMDYRNADGSIAQMCGNGVRVFAHYLRTSGLESRDEFVVGSLAGPRPVVLHQWDDTNADVTVEMGKTNLLGTGEAIVGGRPFAGWRSTWATHIWRGRSRPHPRRTRGPRRRRTGFVRPHAVPRRGQCRGADRAGGWIGVDAGTREGCGRNPIVWHRNRRRRRRGARVRGVTTGTLRCVSPAVRSPSRSPTPAATCAALRSWSRTASCQRNGGVLSVNSGARSGSRRANLLGLMTSPEFPVSRIPSSGELALEDRTALRRVAGLSTELADISEVEYRQLRLERVVLVGVWTEGSAADAEASMAELAALAETAGSEVLEGLVQRRDKPDPSTYIGSGKAQELREVVVATGADTVICDGELSPAQLNALEKAVKVKVIDRTALILDIFAQHATSREGKAQVSFAQMEYMLPRLRGWGESMSRQAGGAPVAAAAAWGCAVPVRRRSRPTAANP